MEDFSIVAAVFGAVTVGIGLWIIHKVSNV